MEKTTAEKAHEFFQGMEGLNRLYTTRQPLFFAELIGYTKAAIATGDVEAAHFCLDAMEQTFQSTCETVVEVAKRYKDHVVNTKVHGREEAESLQSAATAAGNIDRVLWAEATIEVLDEWMA